MKNEKNENGTGGTRKTMKGFGEQEEICFIFMYKGSKGEREFLEGLMARVSLMLRQGEVTVICGAEEELGPVRAIREYVERNHTFDALVINPDPTAFRVKEPRQADDVGVSESRKLSGCCERNHGNKNKWRGLTCHGEEVRRMIKPQRGPHAGEPTKE